MAAVVLSIKVIMSSPNIHSGRPVLIGTTVKVADVALLYTTGERLPVAKIAERYQLSLGQTYAALAYYYLHQAEMDDQIRQDGEAAERK